MWSFSISVSVITDMIYFQPLVLRKRWQKKRTCHWKNFLMLDSSSLIWWKVLTKASVPWYWSTSSRPLLTPWSVPLLPFCLFWISPPHLGGYSSLWAVAASPRYSTPWDWRWMRNNSFEIRISVNLTVVLVPVLYGTRSARGIQGYQWNSRACQSQK